MRSALVYILFDLSFLQAGSFLSGSFIHATHFGLTGGATEKLHLPHGKRSKKKIVCNFLFAEYSLEAGGYLEPLFHAKKEWSWLMCSQNAAL